ncbi:MAG: flagellar brake domain-containing protein [Lachnospiraceae bacterium]|nr:flagellar brake domain-containing protein [Lachnospiraceae bacterium]
MGISVGNKIELVMLDDIIRNEKNKKVYVSKIYDILSGNKLQIAMPIFEGKIVPLSVSDKYSACFYTDKGLLQCNVIVTARYKDGHMFFLEVLILGQLEKVQRRQFYRYMCKVGAKIRVVSDEEYETGKPEGEVISEDDLEWQDARILDISGGGAKIYQRQFLDKNEIVKIKFVLSVADLSFRFSLFARVLGSVHVQNHSEIIEQRLEFMKIDPDDRDNIIKYIFESERLNRAREMGMM